MDLSLSEEQQSLRELVDDILSSEAEPEKLSEILATQDGYPKGVQSALHEAGLTTLGLSDDDEDATLVELGIVLAELGYYAYSGPFLSSVIAALTATRLLGEAGQQVLDTVANGGIATVAEFGSVTREADAISGMANGVDWADGADLLILAIPTDDGRTLAVVDPSLSGLRIESQKLVDGTRAGAVFLDGAILSNAVNVSAAQWRAQSHLMRLLRAADLLGVIRRVQEMTTTHVAQREQFGKPIGQFQAVQHQLANMAIEQEGSKNLIYHALWRYSEGESFERQAAQAGWFLADAAVRATQVANQLHGGIGFMKEYHLHHFHNRSAVQRGLMGPENIRVQELGDVVAEAMERDYQDEFVDWPVR